MPSKFPIFLALLALTFGVSSAFAKDNSKELKKDIVKALQQAQIDQATSLIGELGANNSDKAAQAIVEIVLALEGFSHLSAESSNKIFDACQTALIAISDQEARSFVYKQVETKKGDVRAKVFFIDVLAGYKDTESIATLLKALEDDKQPELVRMSICRALGKSRAVKAVVPLIALVGKTEDKKGDIWYEARMALVDITGEDMPSAADWTNYWEGFNGNFNPETDRGDGSSDATVLRDIPEIFGSEVASKRIVIILDVSGSMHRKEPLSEAEVEEMTQELGAPPPPQDNSSGLCEECGEDHSGVNLPADRMRISRAKTELIRLINELPGDVSFNLIRYSHEVLPWKDALQQANPNTKRQAIQWIENIQHVGTTLTKDALQTAFDLHQDANTFFLISDGVPTDTSGQPMSGKQLQEIYDMVRSLNKFRKVRINTIGFEGAHRAFMNTLAEQNDGEYDAIE